MIGLLSLSFMCIARFEPRRLRRYLSFPRTSYILDWHPSLSRQLCLFRHYCPLLLLALNSHHSFNLHHFITPLRLHCTQLRHRIEPPSPSPAASAQLHSQERFPRAPRRSFAGCGPCVFGSQHLLNRHPSTTLGLDSPLLHSGLLPGLHFGHTEFEASVIQTIPIPIARSSLCCT